MEQLWWVDAAREEQTAVTEGGRTGGQGVTRVGRVRGAGVG